MTTADPDFNRWLLAKGRSGSRCVDLVRPAARSGRLAVGSLSAWLSFVRAQGADRATMAEGRRLWMEYKGIRR